MPALIFMTGHGDVVHRQYARLYPGYSAMARALPEWDESLLDSQELLALLARVERRRTREDETLRSLAAKSDVASIVRRARIHADRARPERARALLEGALKQGDHRSARTALAQLLVDMGAHEQALAAYERLIRAHAGGDQLERWRLAAARLQLVVLRERNPALLARAEAKASLATLRTLAASSKDAALRLESRLVLANAAQDRDDQEELARQLAWLSKQAGSGKTSPEPWTPALLYGLIQLEVGADARRHSWQLVRTWPDSLEAQIAKHGMLAGPM